MRINDKIKGAKVAVLLKIVLWAIVLYGSYCAFLFLMQRHIMFPRGQIPVPHPDAVKIPGLERIWLDTAAGKVEAWFLPSTGPREHPSPAVIFAHGNGELIDFWPDELAPLNRMGFGVLLVEYPGYGRSAGQPSQDSIAETFRVAYDTLVKRKDTDPKRIVLFGRSIGGGAVCAIAADRPSAAMILLSTFVNVRTLAKHFLMPPFFVRDPFDNLAAIKSYPGPILFIHGRYDEVIPYHHSTTLNKAARHGKLLSYDCGHNDCLPGRGTFWQDVELFLLETGIVTSF